jgi:SAM-dependent methyltransferase
MPTSYDDIAGFYDVFWADWYLPAARPALEKLFFSHLSQHARILDVCCGSGHVTAELVRRGYSVAGVDASAELIELAREKVPAADFYVQNVEQMALQSRFDAALSTFDSLNHVLSLDSLRLAFSRVRAHLVPGARFVFDMNLAEAYLLDLSQWQATVSDDMTGLVRGHFDPLANKAVTELIWFSKESGSECWRRRSSLVEQRCYEQHEIVRALREAGFTSTEAVTAFQAGMNAELGIGRIFLVAIA